MVAPATKQARVSHAARDLPGLRGLVVVMSGHVRSMIVRAGRALVEHDQALALQTIAEVHEVNGVEDDIDESCIRILTQRQPMGSDVRLVTLAMKMVGELEHIADLAVKLCECAIKLLDARVEVHAEIPQMCTVVEGMVQGSINAFVNLDAATAESVIREVHAVDRCYQRVFEDLLRRIQSDPSQLQQGIHVLSVAKWLERMGEHSTTIAELVLATIEGRDFRHSRSSDEEEEIAPRRVLGQDEGLFELPEDFDEPLPNEVLDAFGA